MSLGITLNLAINGNGFKIERILHANIEENLQISGCYSLNVKCPLQSLVIGHLASRW